MQMFAFCDDCGTAFQVRPSIRIARGITVTFEGNRAGPCPKCRGMGHIPDGTFNFIDGAVRVLAAPKRTVDELRTLALILEDARTGRIEQEEAIGRIEETVPGLQQLVGALRPNTSTPLQWITALAAVITAVIALNTVFGDKASQYPITHNTEINIAEINISSEREISDAKYDEIMEKVYDLLCHSE